MANIGTNKKRKKATSKKAKPAQKRPAQERHDAFARSYIAHKFNGTRAYMEVFECKNENVASVNASKLIGNANIQDLIQKHGQEALERNELTPERVIEEIKRLGMSNMKDYVTVQKDGTAYVDLSRVKDDEAKMACIQEITSETYPERDGDKFIPVKKTKLKLAGKRENLELLAKYFKILSEYKPSPDKFVAEILQKVKDGVVTTRDAAYELQIKGIPLPEVIRIELSKQEAETSDPDSPLTPEQLEAKFQQTLKDVDDQRKTFVPGRQAEVAQLKEEMKDSESFQKPEELGLEGIKK